MEVAILLVLAVLLAVVALLGLQVHRVLKAHQAALEALEAQANQVLQEHQVHREMLVQATAARTPPVAQAPEATPVKGTARAVRKAKARND